MQSLRRFRLYPLLIVIHVVSSWAFISTIEPRTARCQTVQRPRTDLITSGKELFADQRYEESIQTLSAALLRPGASRDDRIEIYKYLAYNYLVLSQMEEAEAAVRGLFVIDPEFSLPDTESPRFRTFFSDVMKRWEEEGRPGFEQTHAPLAPTTIKHNSPAEWESAKPISISGSIVDPANRASTVMIHYRSGTKGRFQRAKAGMSGGSFRATIPSIAVKSPLLEYYIEAVDEAGLPLATRGDAAAPMRIAIPEPETKTSLFASPWFWIASAVVVAGGVTGAILLTGKSNEDPTPPSSNQPTSRVVVVIGN